MFIQVITTYISSVLVSLISKVISFGGRMGYFGCFSKYTSLWAARLEIIVTLNH